ncbi:unnamed protein product [Rotaria sordida]|uniref:Uncharacterized protein n=1 Tax=Rotaria sordida TaxID=392033 RepID=A0A814YZW7_9BILA|nr:unnamed protein product [Rotaria sordida]
MCNCKKCWNYSLDVLDILYILIYLRANKESYTKITRNDLYLIDSGGECKEGRRDVTRTVHCDQPSVFETVFFILFL